VKRTAHTALFCLGACASSHAPQIPVRWRDDENAAPVAAPDLLDDAIREHVRRVLRKYALNVTRAASALGISRTTLRKWI